MEQLARPRRARCGADDDRADRVGEDPADVDVAGAERAGRLADDEQDAPRLAAAGDGDGQLGRPSGRTAGVDASGSSSRIAGCGARLVWSGRACGQREGLAEDAVAGRDVDEPERPGDVGAGHGARHEPVAARLPRSATRWWP